MRTALLACVCLALVSCSKDSQKQSKLAPNAKLVDAGSLAVLAQVTAEGDFVFSGTTAFLTSATAGTVLIFPISPQTPLGALRYVNTNAATGAGLTLGTRAATLSEGFEELHFKATQTVSLNPATPPEALTLDDDVSGVSYPFHIELSGDDGSIKVDGALAVAPTIDFDLSLDLAKFELDELALEVSAKETFQATIVGHGAVSDDENVKVATVPFTPVIIQLPTPIGDIPLVFTPQVVVELDVKGTATGGFTASVAQDAKIDAKVGYIHGELGGTATTDGHSTSDPATYQGNASLTIQAGPRFEILLYGLVGPYAQAQGTLTAKADVKGPPPCVNWSVTAGITVDCGLELFGDIKKHIYDKAGDIDTYDSCSASGLADARVPRWSESLARNGSQDESARAVVELASGGYLVAADSSYFSGVNGASLALWLLRLNPDGTVVWHHAYSDLEAVRVRSVAEVPGGFLVATATSAWRFDLAGNIVWANDYTANGNAADIAAMVALADGGAVLAGRGGSVSATQQWAMRIDSNGAVVWSSLYGGDHVSAVHVIAGGDLVLAGGSANNARLVRINPNGAVVWQSTLLQQYDDNGTEAGGAILDAMNDAFDVIDTGSGLVAVGYAYGKFALPQGNGVGFYAGWRSDVRYDGHASSSTLFRGGADYDYTRFTAGVANTGGVPLVIGETTRRVGQTDADLLLTIGGATSSLRTNGDDYVYDAAHETGGSPLIATADGGYALAVTTNGFGANNELWLLKLGRAGSVPLTGAGSLSPSSGISLETSMESASVTTNAATALAVMAVDSTASIVAESTPYTLVVQSGQ